MDPYGLECLLPLLAEAHARGAGHSKGRCTSVLRACVRMVSNGLAAKSGFDRIRGWRSRSACRARFRWVRLSGAPLPSPICPGRARGWGRSGSASAFFAPGATGACARGSARATSCSTAASALLRPSSPPAICSRSRRLSRLLCDLEYGERDASNRWRKSSRLSPCFSFFLSPLRGACGSGVNGGGADPSCPGGPARASTGSSVWRSVSWMARWVGALADVECPSRRCRRSFGYFSTTSSDEPCATTLTGTGGDRSALTMVSSCGARAGSSPSLQRSRLGTLR